MCPETRLRLEECSLAEAIDRVGGSTLRGRTIDRSTQVGPTPTVMLREDRRCAYPVVSGIPVLLVPEQLIPERDFEAVPGVHTSDPRYAESYDEMAHYNRVAHQEAEVITAAPATTSLSRVLNLSPTQRHSFPEPHAAWLDATYEAVAQWDAFRHLAPLSGKTVLQVGGKGTHAVRFLLAGAREAWAVSPMVGELEHGRALARHFGVEAQYRCVSGIAEEMPFADETFDAVYSDSCIHHTVTDLAAAECRRILRPGGRFAAIEPWRAPFYRLGIKVFGKREKGINCRPMTTERARPFHAVFDEATVIHHGALTRYPLLALAQLGWELRPLQVFKITRIDDACCSLIKPLRELGSSSAILGSRA